MIYYRILDYSHVKQSLLANWKFLVCIGEIISIDALITALSILHDKIKVITDLSPFTCWRLLCFQKLEWTYSNCAYLFYLVSMTYFIFEVVAYVAIPPLTSLDLYICLSIMFWCETFIASYTQLHFSRYSWDCCSGGSTPVAFSFIGAAREECNVFEQFSQAVISS